MNAIKICSLFLVFLMAGCEFRFQDAAEKPFLFSYEFNSIEAKHQQLISEWLIKAKADKEIKVHTYELEGYKYTYAPSYKDVEVSFIYSKDQGSLKQRFIKGTSEDEVFVKVKFNPALCCSTYIYETDDSGDKLDKVDNKEG